MSIKLLVVDDEIDNAAVAFFGGVPSVPGAESFVWPMCEACDEGMQFQCRLPHPVDESKQILVFQCQNYPGCCDEWDPELGGNRAMVVDAVGSPVTPPEEGDITLDGTWSAHIEVVDCEYEAARDAAESRLKIQGFLGGEPEWIQADETPDCPSCGEPMLFVAQLEEGPNHLIDMNFGGGCGYVFMCTCPDNKAAFLWQC